MSWSVYNDYVPVAERKKTVARLVKKLRKQRKSLNPIVIEGRLITKTFWGKSWCKNLEKYGHCLNRLSQGRAYVRHGCVVDLNIKEGQIKALVSGSEVYEVNIEISAIKKDKWQKIVKQCSGEIDSLIGLLQGKFSKRVIEIITQPQKGLFPEIEEINFDCSCPDYTDMCKHVVAALYGMGARLDSAPEELFLLRQANHTELIASAGVENITGINEKNKAADLDGDLSELFGIDLMIPNEGQKKQK